MKIQNLPQYSFLFSAFVILLVRYIFYFINFFPGFGTFEWNNIKRKEEMIIRIQKELVKAKENPELYQILKYLDYSVILALFFYFAFGNWKSDDTMKLLIVAVFMNYT